jgi:hypothetical protein
MLRSTLCLAVVLVGVMNQAAADEGIAPSMADAAQKFLKTLTPAQLNQATMPFTAEARKDWHWIPKEHRKGLKFREMNAEQRKAAHALLRTGLSDVGFQKALTIFELEAVLHILENDTKNIRDPEKYYYTIFGTPGETGSWGWSVEGHHLSVNYVIADNKLVASTPTFMGANPRWMPKAVGVGPEKGARTLEREETLAFELLKSLTPEQKKLAWKAEIPNKFLVAGPPNNLYKASPVGLPASEMTADQIQILRDILATYAHNVTEEAGTRRLEQIEAAGIDKVHFAWFGGASLEENHFFRIQGPSFILELDNTQADPVGTPSNHIHSVWRNPNEDFGAE